MEYMRKMLAAKIHRATVTESNIDYEGSITMPPQLRQEADLRSYDAVQIWNVTSGAGFETYVINFQPKIVMVDANNKITMVKNKESNPHAVVS